MISQPVKSCTCMGCHIAPLIVVTYLKYLKGVIVEFTSKTLKVYGVEDWFLWHQLNNFVNSTNSSKELDALTGKCIKFVVKVFLRCLSNESFVKKEAFYLKFRQKALPYLKVL